MSVNIVEDIHKLKEKMDAVILAHSYQRPEIQEIADFVGDSLGLCLQASQTEAKIIVFCGVHFMAETAKIINPEKMVLLPEETAGCPMADMASAEDLRGYKKDHPGAAVVSYVNSTAEVKSESDICCTSSNAVKILKSIEPQREIIFVPDRNLGRYAAEQAGRKVILWPGHCPTHNRILPEYIQERKKEYPEAEVLLHPECTEETLKLADFIGSTEQIYQYCCESEKKQFIIGTELGIMHRLKKDNPQKEFLAASPLANCMNMKKISLQSVLQSLRGHQSVIEVDPEIARKARGAIERMLNLS